MDMKPIPYSHDAFKNASIAWLIKTNQVCLFHNNISSLIPITHYSPTVKGKVSLTFDAWQGSNSDAYFTVTGHWIEE
jgi:hypothetical protein